MQLKALRYFVMVASTQSFLATARHYQVPASSVSRFIAALEQDVGQQLLYRSTRAVRLTEPGERFHAQVREALELLDAAVEGLERDGDALCGQVRINAPEGFGRLHLGELVNALQLRHPCLKVDLQLTDTFIDPVQEGADILLRIGPQADSGLIGRTVAAQRHLLVASPAYLDRHGLPQHPEDLLQHACLLYRGQFGTQRWYFRQSADAAVQSLNVTGPLCSNNAEVLLAAAVAGRGLVLFPSWMISPASLQQGTLVRVLDAWEGAPSPDPSFIQLLSPENKHRSRRVREVTQFLLEGLGTPPYWEVT